jgi:hypothetical protein
MRYRFYVQTMPSRGIPDWRFFLVPEEQVGQAEGLVSTMMDNKSHDPSLQDAHGN